MILATLPTPRLYLLCGILLLASCNRSGPHLPKEEMQKVLLDVQLAEVYSTMAPKDTTGVAGSESADSLAAFYREVLAHHHTTAQEFMQSLDWYRAHPDELDSVYNGAMKALDKAEKRH